MSEFCPIYDALRYTIKLRMDEGHININDLSNLTKISKRKLNNFMTGKKKELTFHEAGRILTNLGMVKAHYYGIGPYTVMDIKLNVPKRLFEEDEKGRKNE